MKALTLYRLLCSIVIGILVALGLGSKAYSGWGQTWVQSYSGDVFYEMFWIWLVGAWRMQWRSRHIAAVTFIVSALIECSQLVPFPTQWQVQLWWRLLLGSQFSWADFFYYAVGCGLGAVSLSWLRQRFGRRLC
ncbi:MAG: DUF2809 domain-containing protein [Phormidesmis sp.]